MATTLVLALFISGALAVPQEQIATELELATLYGKYDAASDSPVTVLVELEAKSQVEAKHAGETQTKASLKSLRAQIIEAVQHQINNAKVGREYDYLFSGFALTLPEKDIFSLISIPGIKAVYPNVRYQATSVGEVIPWEFVSPYMQDSAPFIEADEAWDAGYTGAGVTVAIIDTGVDYTHPDLVHAFGDYKGWDFVDNDADPQETSIGDPELDTDHGTHVAGTVAANGLIKGVAPDATLLAYRVLGPGGSGTTENVIAGIERAVQDGADIMNLSLGANVNNPDYATSIALDWAMAEGVVAVTSNGNSGPANWTVGSPGTSREAISVGATQLPYNVYTADIFTSEAVNYPSAEVMGFPNDEALTALDGETLEIVNAGLGYPEDFVGLDFNGKVALISRGEIPFVEKSDNAKAAGAVATIMYNHLDGQIEHYVPGISLPTIKLSNADGQKLLTELEAGINQVSFEIEFSHHVNETVADFSSRGPVMDTWMIKPDVCAPGVGIVSTIPTHNPEDPHGYAAFQGTSMSSPHVAGAAALLLEAHPDWGVDYVKAALMNTAVDIFDENGNIYPHNTQGAGSIRVMQAINTKTLVVPGSHSFGAFLHTEDKDTSRQHFRIHNLSNQRVRYDIDFVGNEGIKVSTSNNLQVQPGHTQNLNFVVQVDSNLEPGYYEGAFLLSNGTDSVKVPTILFVGEPDYPSDPIQGAYFGKNDDGTYYVGALVPFGVDVLEYDIHYFTGGIGPYIATIGAFEDVPGPTHFFDWDGHVYGQELPNGQYVLVIWAYYHGAWTYKAYLVNKE
ncbi:MAG: peptidase S8 [Firmicutes bacterium]|nr:peptidase S8 [Bacillota bacterium]